MGKFGFGKKGDDGEDSNRLALFGSKSKNKSPTPSTNPYAQPTIPPDPYTQAKMNVYNPPNSQPLNNKYDARNGGGYGGENPYSADTNGMSGNDNKYGAQSGGYGGGGYGSDRYGGNSGYGANRYGASGGPAGSQTASRYGAGGYGGLGGDSFDTATEEKRNELFSGAKDRLQQKPQQNGGYGQPPPYEEGGQPPSQSGTYGDSSSSSQGYGGPVYQDRQLTAEEEEEEDVSATKQQVRFIKQEDVSSTRNALRVAQQAEEVGRDTLARLGAQGEHIHNTEKNLDLAHNQNRLAEDRARELKTLNRSMFAVHVSNPFTASSRRAARDQDVVDKHLDEREQREATRRAGYQTSQRLQKTFKELEPGAPGYGQPRGKNLADRAKYQFEADSEDEEMENEIDSNLEALGGATGRLNQLARATGREVDEQNLLLDRIADKVCFSLSLSLSPFISWLSRLMKWTDGSCRYWHSGKFGQAE